MVIEGVTDHCTGANHSDIARAFEWLMGAVVVLENTEREGESCR